MSTFEEKVRDQMERLVTRSEITIEADAPTLEHLLTTQLRGEPGALSAWVPYPWDPDRVNHDTLVLWRYQNWKSLDPVPREGIDMEKASDECVRLTMTTGGIAPDVFAQYLSRRADLRVTLRALTHQVHGDGTWTVRSVRVMHFDRHQTIWDLYSDYGSFRPGAYRNWWGDVVHGMLETWGSGHIWDVPRDPEGEPAA